MSIATRPKNSAAIWDESSAFWAIRDYLTLRMPQTIEGNFLTTYIAANPTPVPPSGPPGAGGQRQQTLSTKGPAARALAPAVGAAPKGNAPSLNFMVKQM